MKRILACVLAVVMVLALTSCSGGKTSALNPKNPTTVTVWNYYNGDQLAAFEQLVEEFNASVGTEKGIVVMTVSQGDISTLADALLDSVNGKVGAQERPTLAAVYSETAFILDQLKALEPLDSYFTKEELAKYVPDFLEDGRFNANNDLLLFPISKSTELFTANQTDWEPFAEATGVTLESIKTLEDLTAAAKTYYDWTDEQTPDTANDGKALYGRDSTANYIYLGCYQLGHELFKVSSGKMTLDMDRDTFKKLWDNYYIPYINGYFGAYAKFRSEDCKTGRILSLTSSSSSMGYMPTAVTLTDDSTHDITIYESAPLPFADAKENSVVLQGASYCMLKSTPAQQEGAVEFLKWFTASERNLTFALLSGYSPATLEANTRDAISKAYLGDTTTAKGQNMLNALLISADVFSHNKAYATKPFEGSKDVRTLLGDALQGVADTDRAAVTEALANGASLEDALAPYVTGEYFDAWFTGLCEQVNALVAH
ncbi:MAG: extracellular solute-binding protein [Eubacteriales bacterium]|nr:extracellular solute-binding protein [Eubacteriales bacterium]